MTSSGDVASTRSNQEKNRKAPASGSGDRRLKERARMLEKKGARSRQKKRKEPAHSQELTQRNLKKPEKRLTQLGNYRRKGIDREEKREAGTHTKKEREKSFQKGCCAESIRAAGFSPDCLPSHEKTRNSKKKRPNR